MSEWQPIESAPKDGTVVIFYVPHEINPSPVLCRADYFHNGQAYWLKGATHWQPLPDPPTLNP